MVARGVRSGYLSVMVRLIIVVAIAATMIGRIAPVAASPAASEPDVRSDVRFAALPDASAGVEPQGPVAAGRAQDSLPFHAGDRVDCDALAPSLDALDNTGLT